MTLVEAVCYLCLDGGVDEADKPVRRDCACRGSDAGYVHLSCLTGFAETKSKQAQVDIIEFRKPWRDCPSCHQKYQNELRIDIATKFVLFVRRQYADDTQRQVEALEVKMCALINMIGRLQPRQKIEAGVTANVLLSLIDRLKGEVSPLPMRYSQMEADAYNVHGQIALDEGTDESARRAAAHFENQLEVNESIGDDDGIATAKRNIAIARSKYDDGNNEELLNASRDVYDLRVAKDGEEHEDTTAAGIVYAHSLRKANRREEARELFMKLLATSKQVFGSDHNFTKSIEAMLQRANKR
jgi:hypothetical protein